MGKAIPVNEQAGNEVFRPENLIGQIRKPYGREGELLVVFYADFPDDYDYSTEPLWVEIDTLAVPLFIHSARALGGAEGSRKTVVVFDDFEKESEASQLIGLKLYTETDAGEEPRLDFEAWIGYRLTDIASGREGEIVEFHDYPNNPLLGVLFDGEEVLVPAVEPIIKGVDDKKRVITATLPEGLFEL